MPRIHAIAAAVLLVAFGCSSAQAGDFAARASGSFAAVGDAGARTTCPDTVSAPMSDADAGSAAPDAAAADGAHSGPTRSARHIGVDDASDVHVAAGADGSVHKPHAAARWQSLLPGVMK